MKTFRLSIVLLLVLAGLAGCKQTQLGGAVEFAVVEIDLLNKPGGGYQYIISSGVTDALDILGSAAWFPLNDLQKSIWLGGFNVMESVVAAEQLYLVTASGGRDTDQNHDGKLDRSATDVLGTWHAIIPGAALIASGHQVSALTEAAYQQVRDRIGYLSDDELLELLDEFAAMVVEDVNADGLVNYADVLAWSRTLTPNKLRGAIELLDALADAIREGEAEYIVRAAAQSVLLNRVVAPVPPAVAIPTELAGTIPGDLVLTLSGSPYLITNTVTVTGELRVEPGVIVRNQGGLVWVDGDVTIEGLPRQRVLLDAVSLNGYSATSTISNADIVGGRLDLRVHKLLLEDCILDGLNLTVSNLVAKADSEAIIRRNVIEASTIIFKNSSPIRPQFSIVFVSNYISPLMPRLTTLISRWNAPVENLVVRDNTFNTNTTFLRSSATANMDIRNNYWGPGRFPLDDIATVIPDNTGPDDLPIIQYQPILLVASPDTPVRR